MEPLPAIAGIEKKQDQIGCLDFYHTILHTHEMPIANALTTVLAKILVIMIGSTHMTIAGLESRKSALARIGIEGITIELQDSDGS